MHTLDWVIIVFYVFLVTGLGIWFGRRQSNIDEFFLGGRSIPWWAALLSLIATEISAATFLGAPEQGYTRNLTYLQFSVGTIAARFAIAVLFIGLYYRFNVYTVYGYLMARFGLGTNTATASVFLLGRLFADGARLFIASLAIHVATGMDVTQSILALALAATIYTLFGGIKGVIWTEVIQASVLIGGALILVYSLLSNIPLGVGQVVQEIHAAGKFQVFDLNFSGWDWLTNPYNVLPAIIGGFFLTMATHGTDQDMVQRLLTCKDSADGKRSMWMSGFLGVGILCVFLFIGQLLFVYANHLAPGHQMAQLAAQLKAEGHNNQFLLHYIVNVLPPGVTGLVLAAVIAAALSSLGSGINATSSTVITDVYQRYIRTEASPEHYVGASRVTTVLVGSIDAAIALAVAYFAQTHTSVDLLSIALGVMTFFYGGMLGIFLVAIFSKSRGNTLTNIGGVVLSIITVVYLKYFTALAWPWLIVVGTAVTVGVSLLGRTPTAIRERFEAEEQAHTAEEQARAAA
ncbi:MAG: sodium/solute symporter [Candidatus Sericytochromatia bacterium]|nr:sodium/solute symporter [Candidatus Sericytochromatia bacterium]